MFSFLGLLCCIELCVFHERFFFSSVTADFLTFLYSPKRNFTFLTVTSEAQCSRAEAVVKFELMSTVLHRPMVR